MAPNLFCLEGRDAGGTHRPAVRQAAIVIGRGRQASRDGGDASKR